MDDGGPTAPRGPGSTAGFRIPADERGRSENLGEHLLGTLVDRAHLLPPRLVAPLVALELGVVGGREVAVYLPDFDQVTLRPLPGDGLAEVEQAEIASSWAGRAYRTDEPLERGVPDGVRLYLPMLDGSDRIGVLAFTLDQVDDDDRRLARRLAGLVADMLVTKGMYTDTFFNARASRPMSLSAQLQLQLLPPLTMTTPRVSVAGILEPAYEVGGDSFDYAYNDHQLDLAIIDAMGHGLEAATMATVAVAAYRHARRADVELADLYAEMDTAIAAQFPGRFATAQMARLHTLTGQLQWVNAGHPPPLHLRGRRLIGELTGTTTRPVGFGGATPSVHTVQLERDDRVLFFTDGLVEERMPDGTQYGEARLHDLLERAGAEDLSATETVRRLSHALLRDREGRTTDDATLFLLHWTGRDEEELTRLP